MGIKVPSALGVCGFSNEAFTEITSPSITTIDQFSVYMGKTAANLYFQEMENKDDAMVVPKVISIKPKLIVRSSTRKNG
jgi:LacI family transcriptional regulator